MAETTPPTFMVEPCPLEQIDRGDTVLIGGRAARVGRVVEHEIERREPGGPATPHPLVELRDKAGQRLCRDVPGAVVHRVVDRQEPPLLVPEPAPEGDA